MKRRSAVVVSPPSLQYQPTRYNHNSPIRTDADRQAMQIARFLDRHPEYARLSPDTLLQYAATYRDDADHALEQEFRDNGVLRGCRIDYKRPSGQERGEVPFSDNDVLEASYALG